MGIAEIGTGLGIAGLAILTAAGWPPPKVVWWRFPLLPIRGIVVLSDAALSILLAPFTKSFWLRLASAFPMLMQRLKGNERSIGWSLLVILILLSVAYLPLLGPSKDIGATRTLIVQVVGGIALLLGFIKGWDEFRHNQAARTEEMRMAREEQVAERFNRAVDQLGHESMDVRIGGIFALEKIAWDYKDYHWTIMEVLCAYVRQHAPWIEPAPEQAEAGGKGAAAVGCQPETDKSRLPQPKTDVWIAVTVICRRNLGNEQAGSPFLPLQHTDLRGFGTERGNLHANLCSANLKLAVLCDVNLEGTIISNANLEDAILAFANLKGANLCDANLKGADLMSANLEGAGLTSANLEGAALRLANLKGAELSWANLEGADLSGANLEGATLEEAQLEGAQYLQWAQLERVQSLAAATLPSYLTDTPVGYARAVRGDAYFEGVTAPDGYLPGKPPEEQPGPKSGSSKEPDNSAEDVAPGRHAH